MTHEQISNDAAAAYAERCANGEYPITIERERDVKVGASDFLSGVKWADVLGFCEWKDEHYNKLPGGRYYNKKDGALRFNELRPYTMEEIYILYHQKANPLSPSNP